MKKLSSVDCGRILGASSCPTCKAFVSVKCDRIKPGILTTYGQCVNCKRNFIVTRTDIVPYEILSGYEYFDGELIARVEELEESIREFLAIEGIQDYSSGYDVMYDMALNLLKKSIAPGAGRLA